MSKFRPIEGAFDPVGDLQVLIGRLQQQVRLRLDQQEHAEGLCVLGQGLEDLDEQVVASCRVWPGAAGRPARW